MKAKEEILNEIRLAYQSIQRVEALYSQGKIAQEAYADRFNSLSHYINGIRWCLGDEDLQ